MSCNTSVHVRTSGASVGPPGGVAGSCWHHSFAKGSYTISNPGAAALWVSSISSNVAWGQPFEDTVDNRPPLPFVLAPGEVYSGSVYFACPFTDINNASTHSGALRVVSSCDPRSLEP